MKESGPVLEAGPDSGPGAGRRGGGSSNCPGAVSVSDFHSGKIENSTSNTNGVASKGDANFEYEDSEWDIGIGNLIIDLDADIEKNNVNGNSLTNVSNSAVESGQHYHSKDKVNNNSISNNSNGDSSSSMPSGGSPNAGSPSAAAAATKGKMAAGLQTVHSATVEQGLKMKIKRTKPGPGTRSSETKHEIVKTVSDVSGATSNSVLTTNTSQHASTATGHATSAVTVNAAVNGPNAAHTFSANETGKQPRHPIGKRNMGTTVAATTTAAGTGAAGCAAGVVTTAAAAVAGNGNNSANSAGGNHKRDKTRDKHSMMPPTSAVANSSSAKMASAIVNGASAGSSLTTSPANSTVNVLASNNPTYPSSTVSMTTASGVTVTPVVSGVPGSSSLRLPSTAGGLTVTPVAAIPATQYGNNGGRTPPTAGATVSPIGVLPQGTASIANGANGNPMMNFSTPVTVTPVSGPLAASPIMIGSLNSPIANNVSTTGSIPLVTPTMRSEAMAHVKTCLTPSGTAAVSTRSEEPSSPPNKKWRGGHLPADKVPEPSPPPPPLPSIQSGNPTTAGAVTVVAVAAATAAAVSSGSSSNGLLPLAASSPNVDCSSVTRLDACVGTCSASTMTEPECLGPCEPGTSVTLEGIVWHETEGGVLVVNVTWRGKTYVGTLLDCTRHDWAPPRFCDSPTSDVESRVPKGRAKRGRGASSTPVPTGNSGPLSESSLSPMHSKLRNGAKGRRGVLPAPPSPAKETAGAGNKRKGRVAEEPTNGNAPSNSKRSRSSSRGAGCASPTVDPPSQPASPVLIECPEPNCSKKYRHINGLKYHQSHAHGGGNGNNNANSGDSANNFDEDSNPETPVKKEKESEDMGIEVAPFTGKVPMPPGQSGTATNEYVKEVESSTVFASPQRPVSSPRTPTPSPCTTANETVACIPPIVSTSRVSDVPHGQTKAVVTVPASRSSVTCAPVPNTVPSIPVVTAVPAITTPVTTAPAMVLSAEHLFTPIVPQPPSTQTHGVSTSTTWVSTIVPCSRVPSNPVLLNTGQSPSPVPGVSVSQKMPLVSGENSPSTPGSTDGDRKDKERSKHKKKNKDKDREKERCDGMKKDTVKKVPEIPVNGTVYVPPIPASTPTPNAVITTDISNVDRLANGIQTLTPTAVDHSREDVQSPAYSDISDANDQPSILDAELNDSIKKDKLTERCLSASSAPPGSHPGLAPFGMYPFFGQPPYMVAPNPTSLNMNDVKMKDERRESGGVGDVMKNPDPYKSLPPSHLYQPFGFMPPYPGYPMDPLIVDATIRGSTKTPEGVLSPRMRIEVSPSRSIKPTPVEESKDNKMIKDCKSPLDLGMPKVSQSHGSSQAPVGVIAQAPAKMESSSSSSSTPLNHSSKTVVDLTLKDKDTVDNKAKLPIPEAKLPMGPSPLGAPGFDPTLLYQRQAEELRRFYNSYPCESEPSAPSGSQGSIPLYAPPMNSPSGSSWPGMISGPKSSPLERKNPVLTPSNSVPTPQPPKVTMPNNASSPKLRPPSVDRKDADRDRREREKERERDSSLDRGKISEGVKPTMETHGPPPPPGPPPGSIPGGGGLPYPYLYPYGLPFDPSHPAYRNITSMLAGGSPYGPSPGPSPPFLPPHHLGGQSAAQLQPGIRYPFPPGPGSLPSTEELNRAHALEMFHQASQYYATLPGPPPPPPPQQSSHKIHELTERALKSPPSSPAVNLPPSLYGKDPNDKLPSSSAALAPNSLTPSSSSSAKMNERRSPSVGLRPPMLPGPGGPHQLTGYLPGLAGSQYPPSSYGGKPLLRP